MVSNGLKIAILGFGREGKAVLKTLTSADWTRTNAEFKNAKIFILDKKLGKSSTKKFSFILGKNYLKNLNNFDVIFRSPGVPYNLPEIQNAIKKGVKFSSGTDLFFQNAEKNDCKIIGITGTKGKGTTSTLLYKILKAGGKNVFLAGNIGKPALDILKNINANQQKNRRKSTFVILELSSFQLQDLKHSPDIAVVLNIFEDHLDSHKNFSEYVNSKANIAKWQKKTDKIFYDASNQRSKWIAMKSPGIKIPILTYNLQPTTYKLNIPGEHNLKNVLTAATVAQSLGIKPEIIKKVVKNYRGMEHRLELVNSKILKNIGINFYNDSASTNPYTAAAAIKAFPDRPKIIIAGGKDKNLDYSPFTKALKASDTKLVILFGENKNKIKKAIIKSGAPIKIAKDLNAAVNLAYQNTKTLKNLKTYKLINIIFSPAAASFDMFKDYKDRGEKFKKIVKNLPINK